MCLFEEIFSWFNSFQRRPWYSEFKVFQCHDFADFIGRYGFSLYFQLNSVALSAPQGLGDVAPQLQAWLLVLVILLSCGATCHRVRTAEDVVFSVIRLLFSAPSGGGTGNAIVSCLSETVDRGVEAHSGSYTGRDLHGPAPRAIPRY